MPEPAAPPPARADALRGHAELLAWRALAAGLGRLSHGRALALGEAVGGLIPRVAPRRLTVALRDLRRVYGATRPPAELEALARTSLRALGANLAELLWLARADRARIEALVDLGEASRLALKEAGARGRGTLLVGVHFGRWELMFLGLAAAGWPVSLVTRPLASPRLGAYVDGIRARLGNAVLHQGRDARALHRALRENGRVLISLDHRDAGPRGARVRFLGRETLLATGIARLALRYDAALLPVYALPLPEGRLAVHVGPALAAGGRGAGRADVPRLTQRLADVLGAVILAHPEQWMWSHKRLWGDGADAVP